MRVTCWFHTVYRPASGGEWRPSETAVHDFTVGEAERLLELFSNGDWEDGPRCLRQILDGDDGEPLGPRRWLPETMLRPVSFDDEPDGRLRAVRFRPVEESEADAW